MKNRKRKWNKILCVLLLISLFPVQVFGAGATLVVDLGTPEGLFTSNIQVEVIRIDSQQGGELSADRAKEIHRMVLDQDMSGTVKATNSQGRVRFTGLERGLYLVFERGGQKVTFAPFLAWIQGGLFTSEPKVEESGNRTFQVTKKWDDGNNADHIRPSALEVVLFRDGKAYRKVNLSALNGWSHTFEHLPERGSYTAREIATSGYRAMYEATQNSCVITNIHENTNPDAVEVLVKVVWVDNNDEAKKRPDCVTVQLLKDSAMRRALTVVKTAAVSEDNQWMTAFDGLEEGTYSVLQYAVDGYTTTYSSEGPYSFVITNTLIRPDEPDGPGGGGNNPPGGGEDPDDPYIPGGDTPGGELPDIPDDPDTPGDLPDGPTIPQMGFITWPIYVLLIVGVLLIVSGTIVRKRGQSES